MKKKGFTLVELLAVIAILAILVIIALPNVMGMFNTAKKNSFTTEVKEVFKTAQQAWMLDNMTATSETQTYKRGEKTVNGNTTVVQCGTNGKTVDLSGRADLLFEITFDKNGGVTAYKATDGTYKYEATGISSSNPLKVENISDSNVVQISGSSDTMSITCN